MKNQFKIILIVATTMISNVTNVLHNNKNRSFYVSASTQSIVNKKTIINNPHRIGEINTLTNLGQDTNNVSAVNVIVNSDKKIDYSYEIFYNKYINTDNIVTTESTNNQYHEKFDSSSKDIYLNGRTTSAKTNSGKNIGGIPLDQLENLYIKIDNSADAEQKMSIKLNGNENTVQKNTQIKVGTEYFSVNAAGTNGSPDISIYKNYVDAFTNRKITMLVGNFASSNPNPNPSTNPTNFTMEDAFGIVAGIVICVIIVGMVIAAARKLYLRCTGGERLILMPPRANDFPEGVNIAEQQPLLDDGQGHGGGGEGQRPISPNNSDDEDNNSNHSGEEDN